MSAPWSRVASSLRTAIRAAKTAAREFESSKVVEVTLAEMGQYGRRFAEMQRRHQHPQAASFSHTLPVVDLCARGSRPPYLMFPPECPPRLATEVIAKVFNYRNVPSYMQPAPFTPIQYVEEKEFLPRTFDYLTHSSSVATAIERIVEERRLRDGQASGFGSSVGVASQPGICFSTEILGREIIHAALFGTTPRVWFTPLDPSAILVARSAYDMADQTTLKVLLDEFPIHPTAYTVPKASGQGFELVIADKPHIERTILPSIEFLPQMHMQQWFNVAVNIAMLNDGVIIDHKGNKYELEQVVEMSEKDAVTLIASALSVAVQQHGISISGLLPVRIERMRNHSLSCMEEADSALKVLKSRYGLTPAMPKATVTEIVEPKPGPAVEPPSTYTPK